MDHYTDFIYITFTFYTFFISFSYRCSYISWETQAILFDIWILPNWTSKNLRDILAKVVEIWTLPQTNGSIQKIILLHKSETPRRGLFSNNDRMGLWVWCTWYVSLVWPNIPAGLIRWWTSTLYRYHIYRLCVSEPRHACLLQSTVHRSVMRYTLFIQEFVCPVYFSHTPSWFCLF